MTGCAEPTASFPAIDCAAETARITSFLRHATARRLNRRGLVLGVSGGVDSAVCAALAVRAVGPERVLALLMPERESSDDGTLRAEHLCDGLGIRAIQENISAALEATGCYRRRDEAIRRVFPDFNDRWRQKIVITGGEEQLPRFNLVVQDEAGAFHERRMPSEVYLQIVAATNFKQRVRKTLEYYHAERLNYAVLGTPNRLEYDLGFFVRGGDGLADVKPIAHLYKTQVYALAGHLGVPDEIRRQAPSTDTYSLPQTQEEFYFALPYDKADIVLHGLIEGVEAAAVAAATGLGAEQVSRVYREFEGKRRIAARTLSDALVIGDDS